MTPLGRRVEVSGIDFPKLDPVLRRMWALPGAGPWNDRLLDGYLDEAVEHHPDGEALVDGATRLRYQHLAILVAKASAGLSSFGVGRGDVVSFQLPNWWESLVLHLAVIRVGAVSNPLMPTLRRRELRYMLGAARSKLFVTAGRFRNFDHAALGRQLQAELPELQQMVVVRAH